MNRINISSTSSRKHPIASRGFPSQNPLSEATAVVTMRIHRCLGLDEPLDDQLVAVAGCVVQRCLASGAAAPWPSPQGEPNGTKGRKNYHKILAPQSESFGIVATGFKEHCKIVGLRCFEGVIELVYIHMLPFVSFCILLKLLLFWDVLRPSNCFKSDKLKHTPTLETESAHNWDATQFENNPQTPWPVSLLLVFHVKGGT